MGNILGLDIGIASVGWSVINSDSEEILDMGVRIFPSADASENQTRRESRGARRILRRKKYRLKRIDELLEQIGLEDTNNINLNPYELRVKGLKEKLEKDELYVALFHLAKRRGISYLDEASEEDISGGALNINRALLKDNYPCEIQLERLNKYGQTRGIIEIEGTDESLVNIFTTSSYIKEAEKILETQSKFYKKIDGDFIAEYIEILGSKRDYYVGPGDEKNRTNYGIYKTDGSTIDNIFDELIGKCSIYETEQRAPSSSYTAQEFNLLNDLNNLTVNKRKLTETEKKEIIKEMLNAKSKSIGASRVFKIIEKVVNENKDLELKGYSVNKDGKMAFNNTLEVERRLKSFFAETDLDYQNFTIEEKDELSIALSKSLDYKTLFKNCKKSFPDLSDENISLLFEFLNKNKSRFSNWHSFSLKLMKEMRNDLYKTSKNQMNILAERSMKKRVKGQFKDVGKIPSEFFMEEIYNPVVRRSINQTIKIINAVLDKYGYLEAIIIEMPRETNQLEEKKKIQKMQREHEKEKDDSLSRARNEYGFTETELNSHKGLRMKIRLWYQQEGKCIYTGEVISISDLINNPNKFEIDHIIPKSISFDDGINNKVLCLNYANQRKGQKTPFRAFYESYDDIKERACKLFENKKISKTKLDMITLEEDLNKYEVRMKFINRNLNDTRYASRVILNGLEAYMKEKSIDTKIHVVRGKFTYQIRKRWGIEKDRDESFDHHSIDAAIIASSYLLGQSEGTVRNPFLQSLNIKDEEKTKFWEISNNSDYDKQVYKLPWSSFISDLNKKTKDIKYSHKVDRKVNRKISDSTIYSTRKIDNREYTVEKYKNIYDDKIAKNFIKKIVEDLEKYDNPDDSKILMRKHDPKTFEIILKIIEEYKDDKPNPFEAYRREHGYIRKYSKKGNGSIIKDIKYLSKELGQKIDISPDNIGDNKSVVLLSIKSFRTDVYYNKKENLYKNINIKYGDLNYFDGKYVLEEEKYEQLKNNFNIDESYKFKFSIHKNEIIGIHDEGKNEELYRVVSSRAGNPNKLLLREIKSNDSRGEITIKNNTKSFKKYHTDILGNLYNAQDEKLILKFNVDNINLI